MELKEPGNNNKRAVLLLSGGIDSYTTMGIAISQGFSIYAMSFDYGQRHRIELVRAKEIAEKMGVEKHLTIKLDLRQIGGSALTDDIEVPHGVSLDHIGDNIPATYVPARNTVFLSVALGWAEVLEASRIFIGVNAVDFSGYPDCRPEYLEAFEKMANLATRTGIEGKPIKIGSPLLYLSKAEIIKKGSELNLDYSLTLSCYDPDSEGRACSSCDSCRLRRQGFLDAGVADPTIYRTNI